MKNILEGINSRLGDTEEQIRELEDRVVEITEAGQKKEKTIKRNKDRLRDLWDNTEHTNILIKGVSEGKERERGREHI